jgi:hypothetical protein
VAKRSAAESALMLTLKMVLSMLSMTLESVKKKMVHILKYCHIQSGKYQVQT